MTGLYARPIKPDKPSENLTDWLAWAYWEIRNNYYAEPKTLAKTIQDDAMAKLENAWNLSRHQNNIK